MDNEGVFEVTDILFPGMPPQVSYRALLPKTTLPPCASVCVCVCVCVCVYASLCTSFWVCL
jgi:hypothetical protein